MPSWKDEEDLAPCKVESKAGRLHHDVQRRRGGVQDHYAWSAVELQCHVPRQTNQDEAAGLLSGPRL